MKTHSHSMKLVFLLSIIVSPFTIAETFMNEEKMLETFSGATLSGISSNGYTGTIWTQVYEEFKEGKTEGNGMDGSSYGIAMCHTGS